MPVFLSIRRAPFSPKEGACLLFSLSAPLPPACSALCLPFPPVDFSPGPSACLSLSLSLSLSGRVLPGPGLAKPPGRRAPLPPVPTGAFPNGPPRRIAPSALLSVWPHRPSCPFCPSTSIAFPTDGRPFVAARVRSRRGQPGAAPLRRAGPPGPSSRVIPVLHGAVTHMAPSGLIQMAPYYPDGAI